MKTDSIHPSGFIKLIRSELFGELIEHNHHAYVLLSVIAMRARRTLAHNPHGLRPGQAIIGDVKRYGLSHREYRTAKKVLDDWGLASFKATGKKAGNGTIASLLQPSLFDINLESPDKQSDKCPTSARQVPDHYQESQEGNNAKNAFKNGRGRRSRPSCREDVDEYALSRGKSEDESEKFWTFNERKDWLGVRDWRMAFDGFCLHLDESTESIHISN